MVLRRIANPSPSGPQGSIPCIGMKNMEKDIGRIKKGEYQGNVTEIVIGIREFNGKAGIDIREFTKSESYTGPTKKGLRIPADKFEEFKAIINSVNPSDLSSTSAKSTTPKSTPLKINPSEKGKKIVEEEEDAGIDEDGFM